MKTLEERAMEYALVFYGVDPDRTEGAFDLKPQTRYDEWQANELKHLMFRDFDIYAVTQAIERAKEVVRMVLPDKGNPDG